MLLSYLEEIPQAEDASTLNEGRHAPVGEKLNDTAASSYVYQVVRVVSRFATKDQTEVCPLSREVMSQPLSEPLQSDFRFFRPPIPA
jgi:hypothetical protein